MGRDGLLDQFGKKLVGVCFFFRQWPSRVRPLIYTDDGDGHKDHYTNLTNSWSNLI